MERFLGKIVKIEFYNESYKCFFHKRWSNCIKNKIVCNFLITNSNRINQIFSYRWKYFLWETKFWKFYFDFLWFSFTIILQTLLWALGDILLLWGTNWNKYYIFQKLMYFFDLQISFKNHNESKTIRPPLKIHFVPNRDNGTWGFKRIQNYLIIFQQDF